MSEQILDMAGGGQAAFESVADQPVMTPVGYQYQQPYFVQQSYGQPGMVYRTTDPNILPQPYSSPADFAAQFPVPLDPTEFVAMCEETALLQALPEEPTSLKSELWRELNSLAFTSGSAYISFADGECPEEYTHDGTNTTVTLKNLGAKKSLSESDIIQSAAIAAAGWNGINRLIGPVGFGQGTPGGVGQATFMAEAVSDLKEKEVRLATTLVMNGWDTMLATGSVASNSLAFDGIETQLTEANGAWYNDDNISGTFSSATYDQFLVAGCAKPTGIYGHNQAIQEMMAGYYQLGFAGSQLVNFESGSRIVPGYNFASMVNTAVGQVKVVADKNFTLTDVGGGQFQSTLYSLRERHNGVPLVYRATQIPLGLKDLMPGCTAISFQVWVKTALIIKHKCAHGAYISYFSGIVATSCPTIG